MADRPDFPPKDIPLSEDVRQLGEIVGQVIVEQCGTEAFDHVERIRHASIAFRRDDGRNAPDPGIALARTGLPEARVLVQSFSAYFQAVNIAERVHRIRRGRAYRRDGNIQARSLADIIQRLKRAGVPADRLSQLFRTLVVEPVFTAHPSEATRRSLLDKQRRIAQALIDRDELGSAAGLGSLRDRIRTEMTSAWQTADHSAERPRVEDELNHVLFHFSNVLYEVVPDLYETIDQAIATEYGGPRPGSPPIPTFLRFGTWVGGDMDGNPNVDAGTVRATLARQRALVVELHQTGLGRLYNRLSQSESRVDVSGEIRNTIARYTARFPDVARTIPARHLEMPYRVLLRYVMTRLDRTGTDSPGGYGSADELIRDLVGIAGSLEANRGHRAGCQDVRRMVRSVETFGFHMATLDIRQNSARIQQAIGEGLRAADWDAIGSSRRQARILEALRAPIDAASTSSPEDPATLEACLDVFRSIGECQRRFGRSSVRNYIVSMTRDTDDLLGVLLLAQWAGLSGTGPAVPLDVVPLFETGDDLERAPEVLARLLAEPVYAEHLAARDKHQMVMVGYSDSNKDAGFFASRWMIQCAQQRIADAVEPYGVDLTVFHGRGGTAGRGGGKTFQGIVAAPAAAVGGRLRVTEQGEIISERYGLEALAIRNLEQTIGATLLASSGAARGVSAPASWTEAAEFIAAVAAQTYRNLVRDSGFFEYFQQATPIDVIERMNIGSRPARRTGAQGIGDLRAIPWAFSWTQSRHLIPGWYGLGTGLEAALARYGAPMLSEMIEGWIFFGSVVADSEMALAKADMGIAARYAGLADIALAPVFDQIRSEYERTGNQILKLKAMTRLLDQEPALQRSIDLRNPYVDPISFIQVDLLGAWRADGRRDGPTLEVLLETVGGIALGLQNTG